MLKTFLCSFLLLAVAACGESKPNWETAVPVAAIPDAPLGVADHVDWSALEKTQGLRVTPEKVRLGRLLFFDKRLSADGTVSCATCHRPGNAFSEPTATSTGIKDQIGTRKAPPIVNAAFPLAPVYFWDGRAKTLAEQAKGPIENPIEMGNTLPHAAKTIAGIPGYQKAFRELYGEAAPITADLIADAIAAFEATLFSGNSAWDRYQAGDDNAVTAEVIRGAKLFHEKAECNQCHLGFNFTDSKFHNLGVGWQASSQTYRDEGRSKISGSPEDLGAFKTPTLRDVTLHAPYMHDGSIATLEEVVEHYNKGGTPGAKNLSPKIRKLNLTPDEVKALVAFMEALTSEGAAVKEPPAFP